ncbi:hypothetical protein [Bradyrhizobium sp. 1]|uniref:hypothetical protein n=1 Tax=Bradyrhizobium sp. 1 TaxID=241591 RepID=UPI001FF82476|nr:hypothetical protein [Bradyrhizobium sp. 1]MCK1394975.1 hypothetical protein [Bradyrhizobium sp. 1]
MDNLIHNEKQKLHATYLNNLGVAALVGGVIAPVFGAHQSSVLTVAGSFLFGGIMSAIFHAGAIWCLSALKQ